MACVGRKLNLKTIIMKKIAKITLTFGAILVAIGILALLTVIICCMFGSKYDFERIMHNDVRIMYAGMIIIILSLFLLIDYKTSINNFKNWINK